MGTERRQSAIGPDRATGTTPRALNGSETGRQLLNMEAPVQQWGEACTHAVLRGILSYLGCRNPTAVMADQWAFFYSSNEINAGLGIRSVDTQQFAGLRRFGYSVDRLEASSFGEAWMTVRSLLDDRLPVAVYTDQSKLPYKKNVDSGALTIIVNGYEDDELAWIIDRDQFMGTIGVDELENAVETVSNWWMPDAANEHHSYATKHNVVLAIRPPVKETTAELPLSTYIRETVDHVDRQDGACGEFLGPIAIRRFATDLANLKGGDAASPVRYEGLSFRLSNVVWSRRTGTDLFGHAAVALDDPGLMQVASLAKDIYDSWMICQAMVYKLSHRANFNDVTRVKQRLDAIADAEANLADHLRNRCQQWIIGD